MADLLLSTPIYGAASRVLSDADTAVVAQLLKQVQTLGRGNAERARYYEQRQAFKDFKISTPPQVLQQVESVLGWPAKAVDVLADRISFAAFTTSDGSGVDPFGLNEIADQNHFRAEFAGATTSTLINSCAFIVATQGLPGEPDVLWLTRTASEATGLWDRRKRQLSAGLSVLDWGKNGEITAVAVYLPDKTVEINFSSANVGSASIIPNRVGRPLMVHTAFKPNLHRPFGFSRITRAVRSLTDSATRTIVRSEIGAEFFAAPQRYGIGVDDSMGQWTALLGRFLTLELTESGEKPEVGQFTQQSMQPHTDQLRMWTNLFAAETSIPVSELGFVSENPSSDAAIQSQRDPLRQLSNSFIRDNQSALSQLAAMSVMLRDGLSEPPDGISSVSARFEPTVQVTDAGRADALLKQVAILPWLADSPIALEMLGYDQATINRLLSDKARSSASSTLDRLLSVPQPESVSAPEAE